MSSFIKHDDPALIWTGELVLEARLTIPAAAPGLIIIAGLGGTFHHDGLRSLAAHFHDNGFATLIVDLLTPDEQQFDSRTRHFRTDVPLLAKRIGIVAGWLAKEQATRDLPVAFFGSGLIGSAALLAIAHRGIDFFAMAIDVPRLGVVRGAVSGIKTPALLLIDESSGKPEGVLEGEVRVETIPSLTPLLESRAALEKVARKSLVWFRNHVPAEVLA